jgi:hypothetical protein
VPPSPLDPEHVVSPIKEVLVYLTAHPGTTREGLLRALCPNAAPDSPESKAVLSPLGWLIERGHIIEFFDGSMAVPLKTMTPSAAPPPKNAAPPPAAGRDHER